MAPTLGLGSTSLACQRYSALGHRATGLQRRTVLPQHCSPVGIFPQSLAWDSGKLKVTRGCKTCSGRSVTKKEAPAELANWATMGSMFAKAVFRWPRPRANGKPDSKNSTPESLVGCSRSPNENVWEVKVIPHETVPRTCDLHLSIACWQRQQVDSLLAQQDRWIHRQRALRRNPGGEQPEQHHSQHNAGQHQRIARSGLVDDGSEHAAGQNSQQ
jgi:hypothetical protein